MQRNFRELARAPFDVLVIGGGIYGAWIAYDAALRGLRVALVERNDWASGTSSATSKLIHGGLRYLEQRQIGLVRKALDERRRLTWLGPHRVRPIRFIIPVYSGARVGRLKLRLGLWLYDRLAGRGRKTVGRTRSLTKQELTEEYGLPPEGLRGGFAYGDCQTDDARFTLEIVDGALQAGAVAVNHAEVTELVVEDGRVGGAMIRDGETGVNCRLRAGITVNCAGPSVHRLVAPHVEGFAESIRLSKGVHAILPGMRLERAFVLSAPEDRRIVFVMPWYGKTLLGTTDTDYSGDPDAARVEERDITYLLERAARFFPEGPWSRSDVIASFCGLRTLPASPQRSPSAVSREWRLEQPMDGLITSIGGKLTSARADAVVAVTRVARLLGKDLPASSTARRRFPWAGEHGYRRWARGALADGLSMGLDEETAANCVRRHGTRVRMILALIREKPELAGRVVEDAPFCMAEIVHAISDEMALTLEDVLRRRVPLLLVSRLPESVLREVTAEISRILGWSARRREEELQALAARFRPALMAHDHG